MNIIKLSDLIIHADFENQNELALTFLRPSEYIESPEFKGKIFTLEEYVKWYVANSPEGRRTGKFTYASDWDAFNFPSNSFNDFYNGKFNPLSDREKRLLDKIDGNYWNKLCLIGTSREADPSYLEHELAHAFFELSPEYRNSVTEIIEKIPANEKKKICSVLGTYGGGYDSSVFTDETHAWILTDQEELKKYGVNISELHTPARSIRENLKKASNKLLSRKTCKKLWG